MCIAVGGAKRNPRCQPEAESATEWRHNGGMLDGGRHYMACNCTDFTSTHGYAHVGATRLKGIGFSKNGINR